MRKYILHRLWQLIPVIIGVTFIVFTLLYISPGDPVKIMMGESVSQEVLETTREQMGLNDPFLVRYANYLKGIVFDLDLGTP